MRLLRRHSLCDYCFIKMLFFILTITTSISLLNCPWRSVSLCQILSPSGYMKLCRSKITTHGRTDGHDFLQRCVFASLKARETKRKRERLGEREGGRERERERERERAAFPRFFNHGDTSLSCFAQFSIIHDSENCQNLTWQRPTWRKNLMFVVMERRGKIGRPMVDGKRNKYRGGT